MRSLLGLALASGCQGVPLAYLDHATLGPSLVPQSETVTGYDGYTDTYCAGQDELGGGKGAHTMAHVRDLQACARTCTKIDICNSFEYEPATQACRRSSTCTTLQETTHSTGVNLYVRKDPKFIPYKHEVCIERRDNTTIEVVHPSRADGCNRGAGCSELEACADLCDRMPACVSFEFKQSSRDTCELSSACTNETSHKTKSGWDLYVKTYRTGFPPPPLPPGQVSAVTTTLDFPSGSASTVTSSVDAIAAAVANQIPGLSASDVTVTVNSDTGTIGITVSEGVSPTDLQIDDIQVMMGTTSFTNAVSNAVDGVTITTDANVSPTVVSVGPPSAPPPYVPPVYPPPSPSPSDPPSPPPSSPSPSDPPSPPPPSPALPPLTPLTSPSPFPPPPSHDWSSFCGTGTTWNGQQCVIDSGYCAASQMCRPDADAAAAAAAAAVSSGLTPDMSQDERQSLLNFTKYKDTYCTAQDELGNGKGNHTREHIKTLEDCADSCSGVDICTSFEWEASTLTCTRSTTCTAEAGTTALSGTDLYVKKNPLYTPYYETACHDGSGLSTSHPVKSDGCSEAKGGGCSEVEACADLCTDSDECISFQYKHETNRCTLTSTCTYDTANANKGGWNLYVKSSSP